MATTDDAARAMAEAMSIEEIMCGIEYPAALGECPRCYGLAPIGGDCPSPKCVAFREWALAHQDDEEKTP